MMIGWQNGFRFARDGLSGEAYLPSLFASFGPLGGGHDPWPGALVATLFPEFRGDRTSSAGSKASGADGATRPFVIVGPDLVELLQAPALDAATVAAAVAAAGADEAAGVMVLVSMRGLRTDSGFLPGPMIAFYDPDPGGSGARDLLAHLAAQKPIDQNAGHPGDLPAVPSGWVQTVMTPWVEGWIVQPGHVLSISTADIEVKAGQQLSISASAFGEGQSLVFDGSDETDGSFQIVGGNGDDEITGGRGDDFIEGGRGGDLLRGGPGADVFAYWDASDSTGTAHDSLFDFDPAEDKIDLPFTVTGFAAAVTVGSLSRATFDEDLAAALGGLGAGQAILFRPNDGELLGEVFLIVDANGEAGYQPGEDYVFALPNTDLADLSGSPDIFI